MIYSAVAALLVLSSCSSAYKTSQTPDDVYYSPARERVYANNTARSTRASNVEETYDDNGNNYVTYQNEDEERYDYARRIDRFSRGYNGNYWDGYYFDDYYSPSVYVNNYYGFGNRWGWGSYWGPSLSFGLSWGGGYNPWGWNSWYGGGWGSPYGYYGYPWNSGWYGSYYPGYYPGWYGHGSGYYYAQPRPANSWGPRGSSYSRVFNNGNYVAPTPNTSGSAPRRVFDGTRDRTVPNTGNGNTGMPRRVFDRAPSERPSVQPGNGNQPNYTPRRTFDRAPSERPVTQPSDNTPRRTFDRSERPSPPPVRQEQPVYRAPAPERSAPQRSFPSSAPSSSPSNNGGGSPSRSFPRGG